MIIDGFNKLTLLDYPKHAACIIFTRGCNFRCVFCQNSPLIENSKQKGLIDEEEVLNYLMKRKNVLDGIVISGGEPTLQKDLVPFIKKVKKMSLKVKLDTNGTNPAIIKELLDNNLVDYIAMDIKDNLSSYEKIINYNTNISLIKQSIKLIKESKIDHEFRTTIIKEYHNIENIKSLLKDFKNENYYLQNFVDSENVLVKNLHGFTNDELKNIEKIIKKDYPNVQVRGLI